MKISTGRFQYTAIDDCTRLRVLGLYPRRTASNAVHFLEQRMIEESLSDPMSSDRSWGRIFRDGVSRDPATVLH